MIANPSVQEFCKNTQDLRVINSFCRGPWPVKGNCRRNHEPMDIKEESMPLEKITTYNIICHYNYT